MNRAVAPCNREPRFDHVAVLQHIVRHQHTVLLQNTQNLRQKMNVPRGERYELCRSVHAEANAIISASRGKMIGSTLYLVGKEVDTGEYVKNSNSCSMCKRMIINAGIDRVYIRDSKDEYRMIHVQQWIDDDESLAGSFGY